MTLRNGFDWLALVLVIVGGLNWLLVGLFNFNLVDYLFGSVVWLEALVYILVGLAAIYMIYYAAREGKTTRPAERRAIT